MTDSGNKNSLPDQVQSPNGVSDGTAPDACAFSPALGRLGRERKRTAGNPMMAQGSSCSIKEASQRLGVPASTLRYWESVGLIESERRPGSNYRTYSIRDLFAASYVSFFRNMGVPVRVLADSQDNSLADIVALLESTQEEVDRRLRRLERIRERLDTQRMLARNAETLLAQGVREASPTAQRFVSYDPDSEAQQRVLMRDSQRYGVLIDASAPDVMMEGCIDFLGDDPSGSGQESAVLWEREEEDAVLVRYFEGISFSEQGGPVSVDVTGLFAQAREAGHEPLYALAHFLVTANFADEGQPAHRLDCYRVWVAYR